MRGDNRVFGGVLSGVGARIGMAAAPARIIFVVIALFTSGLGLLAYAAAWALLPDTEGRIIIQDFGRGRPNVGALVAIAIIALFGFGGVGQIGPGDFFNWSWGANTGWFDGGDMGPMSSLFRVFAILAAIVIPLAIVAGVVALIVWAVRSSKTTDRAAQGYARLPDGSVPDAPAASSTASAADAPAAQESTLPPETLAVPAAVSISVTSQPPMAPPPPTVYSAPPTPPWPRVPGPGKVGYLLALAWIPITIAITLYLSTTDQLAVFGAVAGGVIYVAGLGLILVITALRGRKLGFLGFVSVVALIPVAIAIGTAPELREHYSSGDWRDWVNEQVDAEISVSAAPVESIEAPDPFDPTEAFDDYSTVAIAGQCSTDFTGPAPTPSGTISLAEVSGPTTLTVATDITRVVIPSGTNLAIVTQANADYEPYVGVTWVDRGVTCSMTSGVTDLVTLKTPDAPVLTLVLGEANASGSFDIYIEEN